jgi:hypothetical protein
MYLRQQAACAICLIRKPQYVDHCHATGKVRGLLCPSCNTALGFFKDSARIVERAKQYLQDGGFVAVELVP